MLLDNGDEFGVAAVATRVKRTARGPRGGYCYACLCPTTNTYEPCWACKWLPRRAARTSAKARFQEAINS